MVVSASAAVCPCGSAKSSGRASSSCRARCNSAKQRNQFFSLGSRITFLRFFIGDTSTCPGSGSASTWSKASLASAGGASGGDKPSPRFHHAGGSRPTSSGNSSPAMIEQSAPGSVVPENARPPVLSPDACQRQAPRFPPRSLTLAHPRSASQQESARAPVAPGSGRSGAPSAPDQHNIETRFGPNDDGSKRLHVTTTRAGRTK